MHNFPASLAKSHEYENAPWWGEVYRAAFPSLAAMVSTRKDGWAQRGGIDRVLTLQSGRTFTVDEKVREKDWPDFALETWSDRARKSPGWMQKELAIDFLAYAFVPSSTCYLFPFATLRCAWLKHGREWMALSRERKAGFCRALAENDGWTTESVCVPRQVLLDAIRDAMVVEWHNA